MKQQQPQVIHSQLLFTDTPALFVERNIQAAPF